MLEIGTLDCYASGIAVGLLIYIYTYTAPT